MESKHRILLVDDEPAVLEILTYNLKKKGYNVKTASTGFDALVIGKEFRPDIIILDWMMPEMDGLATCRAFRLDVDFDDTVITFLTANDDDFSRIEGFEAGADDYIHKRIKPAVFVAKVDALLRRKKVKNSGNIIQVFDLEIFVQKRLVKKAGTKVELTKIEFNLLSLFLSNRDKVFSRQEIHESIWGQNVFVGDRTLDVHIRNLRRKIGEQVIETSKGVGYTLG